MQERLKLAKETPNPCSKSKAAMFVCQEDGYLALRHPVAGYSWLGLGH